jgi:hypothetical protein
METKGALTYFLEALGNEAAGDSCQCMSAA